MYFCKIYLSFSAYVGFSIINIESVHEPLIGFSIHNPLIDLQHISLNVGIEYYLFKNICFIG